MLILSEVSELKWSDLVNIFKAGIFLFLKRSFFEAQRIPSLLIKSFWHTGACVRECILRGLCGRAGPIGTSSFNVFKGKQLHLTWLWRSALVGNISFNRLTLVAGVKVNEWLCSASRVLLSSEEQICDLQREPAKEGNVPLSSWGKFILCLWEGTWLYATIQCLKDQVVLTERDTMTSTKRKAETTFLRSWFCFRNEFLVDRTSPIVPCRKKACVLNALSVVSCCTRKGA